VFALWQGGGIVYYAGPPLFASRSTSNAARTISAQRAPVQAGSRVGSRAPSKRAAAQYASAHHSLPLWNDPQRVRPTRSSVKKR